MAEQGGTRVHNVIIEQRKKLNMSGVSEVVSFEDETIVLKTSKGSLTIKGEGLHIGSFSTSSGEIDIDGSVTALVYTAEEQSRGGFFRKLMK